MPIGRRSGLTFVVFKLILLGLFFAPKFLRFSFHFPKILHIKYISLMTRLWEHAILQWKGNKYYVYFNKKGI